MEAERHAGSWPTDPFSPQHLSAEISHFCLAATVLSSPGMSWGMVKVDEVTPKAWGIEDVLS